VTYSELIHENFTSLTSLLRNFSKDDSQTLETEARRIAEVIRNGGTIFWCGNGGSAADSQHLSAELIGRLVNNRMPLASVSLNADISAITCIANDFGYETIFERQLEGLAKNGDYLVALSTSGESPNVLRVLSKAQSLGVRTLSLLGKGGGSALQISDRSIVVASPTTARIQEMHKIIGHTICQIVERELGFVN
jgi:D-sedoheptulose 7-phosphate isomerase